MNTYSQNNDYLPGTWKGLKTSTGRSASFTCPNGHTASLVDHTINPDGRVEPSVVCPYEDCQFHEYIQLAGLPTAFYHSAGANRNPEISDDKTPTLKTSNAIAVQQSRSGVRRLTPTECERLQGFPDGWTAVHEQADSKRYKQLGNAVAVPVAEWIGQRIVTVDMARK